MDILSAIEAYLKRTGMAATRFGTLAVKDGNFVGRLRRDPKGVTLRTVEKVRKFMADNPPGRRNGRAA